MSKLIETAFTRLYPDKQFCYSADISYSSRFSDYNANIKLRNKTFLEVSLSRKWRGVNDDILIGLIQTLLLKIFHSSKNPTVEMELYSLFIKNLHLCAPKNIIDPQLEKMFDDLNKFYFDSQLETPNLVWGSYSLRKLGSYDFQTDTITLSKALTQNDLLRYVLYHEMLHKHCKFSSTGKKNSFHSPEFKEREQLYPDYELIEKKLRFLPQTEKKRSFLQNLFR